jgi:16S rRNA (cytidine1402-2'-O)-methyltransferase
MPLNLPIHKHAGGCLYVVATPIGNLDDITLRAIKVLAQVDLIAAEDTRHTRQLLAAHHIATQLISFHEHNEQQRTPELIEKLQAGARLALVTDAGTPTVSDPGYRLVEAATRNAIPVVPLPGASAVVTALSAAGLPTDTFTFAGFPLRKKEKRLEQLRALAPLPHVVIFFQSPRRLSAFIRELLDIFGDRRAVLARELTKIHEEFIRGPLSQILMELEQRPAVKGECTLLVSGAAPTLPAEADIETVIKEAVKKQDQSLSDIAKGLAKELGVSRKEIYDRALAYKKKIN